MHFINDCAIAWNLTEWQNGTGRRFDLAEKIKCAWQKGRVK